MGFAWHKLIPRNTIINCPPPCDFTYETTFSDPDDPIIICPPFDPYNLGTPQACGLYNGLTTQYGGAACGNKDVLEFTFRSNPGGPLEMRLNVPLTCSGNNNPDFGDLRPSAGNSLNGCEMGTVSISEQLYYYRTPNSPSATPTQIASTKLCLKYNPFIVADRFMIISGRNRYKYGGWGVDPSCDTASAGEYGPPLFWDDPSIGGFGLKQYEQSLGREWPLPNSVLNLPLFGAEESPLSVPQPTGKCGDGACDNGECFAIVPNDGTGHFGVQTLGNGKGYYSFQCFNPMGYLDVNPGGSEYQRKAQSIPTCSLWSLANVMWHRAWKLGLNSSPANEAEEIAAGAAPYFPYQQLLQADPSGLTGGGESNVTAYLRGLFSSWTSYGGAAESIVPNVFLWDRENYILASTNEAKWKHIYVIGNANVIFDTQCMKGTFDELQPYSSQDKYGFVIHLDEVSHDPAYGSSGNARMLGFYGCNKDYPFNLGSEAIFGLKTMDCALNNANPRGGIATYCDECSNENTSGQNKIGNVTQKCYHVGHVPDCALQDGVQGL